MTRFRITYLIWILVLVILLTLLSYRYVSFNLPLDSIVLFYISCLLIFGLIFFSIIYFKSILNPGFFYSFFLLLFSFSLIPFSSFSVEFSKSSILIILLSSISFLIGALTKIKLNIRRLTINMSPRSRLIVFYTLTLLCISAFAYEIYLLKYIPVFSIFKYDVYGDFHKSYTPLLNSFILLSSVIPVWTLILKKQGLINKYFARTIIGIISFILINHFARTTFAILALCLFSYYIYYYSVKVRFFILSVIGFVVLFVFIGYLRMGMVDKIDRGHEIIKNISGVKYETTVLETYFTLYSSVRFYTFDKMVQEKQQEAFYGLGSYTLRPIFNMLPVKSQYFNDPQFNSLRRLATYAIEPFLDFGIIGVIIINFIYGIISFTIFSNFRERRKSVYIVLLGIILYCFITMPFTNSFNLFFIWITSFFNGLIIRE